MTTLENPERSSVVPVNQFSRSGEVFRLAFLLVSLQWLDALLTGIGVSHFGTQAEGNQLIRNLMLTFGHTPALCLVKMAATFFTVGICCTASRITWVAEALRALLAIYLLCAILPWTIFLSFKL